MWTVLAFVIPVLGRQWIIANHIAHDAATRSWVTATLVVGVPLIVGAKMGTVGIDKTVVNDILQKIPGESFPLLFLILAISVLYIWIKWKEDALLVKEIHDLKNPTGERMEEIEKKIIDRCGIVPLIAMIIAAGLVAVIGSDYYMTGGLSLLYFYVACYPLLYQIMAVIIIRLEVQDAKLVRKVDLFERKEKHHE